MHLSISATSIIYRCSFLQSNNVSKVSSICLLASSWSFMLSVWSICDILKNIVTYVLRIYNRMEISHMHDWRIVKSSFVVFQIIIDSSFIEIMKPHFECIAKFTNTKNYGSITSIIARTSFKNTRKKRRNNYIFCLIHLARIIQNIYKMKKNRNQLLLD